MNNYKDGFDYEKLMSNVFFKTISVVLQGWFTL